MLALAPHGPKLCVCYATKFFCFTRPQEQLYLYGPHVSLPHTDHFFKRIFTVNRHCSGSAHQSEMWCDRCVDGEAFMSADPDSALAEVLPLSAINSAAGLLEKALTRRPFPIRHASLHKLPAVSSGFEPL